MTIRFEKACFEDTSLQALLEAHRSDMYQTSPAESVHTLDWDALQSEAVSMWSLLQDSTVVGCGALRELSPRSGELKSMRVDASSRRKGLGTKLLSFLESVAMERGYARLYLETGTQPFFEPAQKLYRRFGYQPCPPFGSYREDPHSMCMTKGLESLDLSHE